MALLKEKFEYKLQHPEELTGRCYRFVGKRDLFPEDLKPVMYKLMLMTKNNTTIVVNIAFAYTGRDEIVSGVNTLVEGIRNNELALNSNTESLFEQSFHNFPVSPVDLFVRTGECRLSDFLTWESNDEAVLTFIEDYWPNFSYWKFLWAIFYFQTNLSSVSFQVTGSDCDAFKTRYLEEQSQNLNEFVRKKRRSEWNVVELHAKSFGMDARVSASGVDECRKL
ncbi:unnamed protein product [Orchesella dallaii]|uniref:ditrans,polycis-polyprenyl diphosphate synthase [(2E,6E)-farnesyldiphosphate specific] n=1 Tax=Orchesella dallaii TaxID=48710 RepID=A0ABP1RM86_9HEXA